ncbi:HutD/Ves family protein [Achromobacter aloeverae]
MADQFERYAAASGAAPRLFRLADVPARPWKNGGGVTREIVCWPPGAGLEDFLWRISVARIDADGPFSRFEGVDRVIALLDGPGVVLRGGFAAGKHALTRPLAPFAFPGDAAVECELRGGATEDFNVMSRRGRVRVRVSVLRGGGVLPPAFCGLLLAVGGAWRAMPEEGAGYMLAPLAGLWWAQAPRGWRALPEEAAAPARDAAGAGRGLLAVAIEMSPDGGAQEWDAT